ncbi:F0F1 ATP synthase subunit gamma [Actinomadura atramentaria]|uniref:F0F1 ATP synthase subunit gamma n=1 Tax=Actinomadura atramentaria TaxID=1990 RepID=UPI000382EB7B|nr:F0F1 ATP synthase subunit gamma [Actinomadura atramentaria]
MAAQLRALRSRIRSVKSTAKITRAQELIAAARISGAQQRLAAAKPYADQVTRAVSALISHHVGIRHPLLDERPDARRAAVLIMTSDRGFCGAYNQHALKEGGAVARMLRERGSEPRFYLTGQKAIENFRFNEREAEAVWGGISGQPPFEAAADIGGRLLDAFTRPADEGGVGEVHVVYTEFVSMLSQRVAVRRILPLEIREAAAGEAAGAPPSYEFEPIPELVLDGLLRQYVNGRIWRMLLDSAASEWAARRSAMMSATDNANELVQRLTREANEARQDEITMELTEIVAGANALTSAPE